MAGNVYTLHFKLTDGTEKPIEFIVPQGVSVTGAQINDEGHLIIALSDGNTIDAGEVKGEVNAENLSTATNLVNGVTEGSICSVGTIKPDYSEGAIGLFYTAFGNEAKAVGSSAFAAGQRCVALGNASRANGIITSANGEFSSVDGCGAVANGEAAHAEGNYTKSNGKASHAEGDYTEANGDYSHAEGWRSKAIGKASHAEGWYAETNGDYSHAEGEGSRTLGKWAHAEGKQSRADSDYQHVQGKYNIADAQNKYAHIVGNGEGGSGDKAYSNAHTLDWNGNAWFAGDVIVGGKNQDDAEAKVLATHEYVDGKVGEIEIPEMPEIPTVLPNPNALTFSGAVNGSYDGSAPLSVNIPDGVKSWNDLEDKPFDMSKQVILSETTLVGNMDDGSTTITDPLPVEPVVGKTYVVNWHGKKYECVAGEVDIDFMCTYLGNVGAAGAEGFEDTGEPFMILFVPSAYAPAVGFTAAIYVLDGSTGGVVSVDYVEVIKKIDEALLPEDYINSLIDAKIAAMMQNNT